MKLRRFTSEDDKVINEMFLDHKLQDIADKLNRSLGSVYGRTKFLGLNLTPELKHARKMIGIEAGWRGGEKTRFKKGQPAHNKGVKMSLELREKVKHTWFKKGHIPKNHVEIGTEITTADGYLKIKVAEPNKWEFLQRFNWEKENGPIPKGMLVVFKNNNKLNCEPSNLKLITRAENMNINTIHNYPEDIVKATMTIARLTREINKQTKE